MNNTKILMLLGISFAAQAQAFPCFLTVVKNNCWLNYNVTVVALNARENKSLAKVIIPENTPWSRVKFNCNPGLTLKFQAQFTPAIWEVDQGKTYNGVNYWILPEQIKKGDTAWSLTICYSNQFSEVPLPPEAFGHCVCDTQKIPPVPPQ